MSKALPTAAAYPAAAGFTLIEILLVLAVFCLLLAMGYQSVVYTAQARTRVVEQVEQQQDLRGAHRTLNNAFSGSAPLLGSAKQLIIDLDQSDSRWLSGSSQLILNLDSQGQLLAEYENPGQSTVLLTGMQAASFHFIDDDIAYSSWSKSTRPQLISLEWSADGRPIAWKFLIHK